MVLLPLKNLKNTIRFLLLYFKHLREQPKQKAECFFTLCFLFITFTLEHYAHMMPNQDDEVADIFHNALQKSR